jgi:hypothetical protein
MANTKKKTAKKKGKPQGTCGLNAKTNKCKRRPGVSKGKKRTKQDARCTYSTSKKRTTLRSSGKRTPTQICRKKTGKKKKKKKTGKKTSVKKETK